MHVRIHQADFFGVDLRNRLEVARDRPAARRGQPSLGHERRTGPARVRACGRRSGELTAWTVSRRSTGSSNFDVAEAVWLKLIAELADQAATIALLCKTSVARRILERAHRQRLPIANAVIRRLDASKWFGAAVDACLFQVELGTPDGLREVPVYESLAQKSPTSVMGFAGGWLIADRNAYAAAETADGVCPLTWRQGLKHDAAAVMELVRDAETGQLRNRAGEIIDVEPEFVYPLIKGGDLARDAPNSERAVLVTQERIGADTRVLRELAPRLWSYLAGARRLIPQAQVVDLRRPTSVCDVRNRAVQLRAVEGGHRGVQQGPRFRALGPREGKPVMLDDTCYFLPCSSGRRGRRARRVVQRPAHPRVPAHCQFHERKRPFTKALLQRIDLAAILVRVRSPVAHGAGT